MIIESVRDFVPVAEVTVDLAEVVYDISNARLEFREMDGESDDEDRTDDPRESISIDGTANACKWSYYIATHSQRTLETLTADNAWIRGPQYH